MLPTDVAFVHLTSRLQFRIPSQIVCSGGNYNGQMTFGTLFPVRGVATLLTLCPRISRLIFVRRMFPLRLAPSRLLSQLDMSVIAFIALRAETFTEVISAGTRVSEFASYRVALVLKMSFTRASLCSWVSSEARVLPPLPVFRTARTGPLSGSTGSSTI